MMNREHSDGVPDEPDTTGFRPTGRQVVGVLAAIALVVFMITNSDDVPVELLFTDVELALWVVIAISALLGLIVGMVLGSRRAKAKLLRD